MIVDYSVQPVSNTLHYSTDIAVPAGQNGRLIFQPGETRKVVQVQIVGDKIAEPNEQFRIVATPVQNAKADDIKNIQQVTIRDDDDAVVSIRALAEPFGEASEFEGGAGENTVVTFQIILGEKAERDVTVQYRTQDDTARVSDHDYQFKSDRVVFTNGGNKGDVANVTFTIIGDSKKEKTESFNVELVQNPLNRIVRKSVKVKIVNDD